MTVIYFVRHGRTSFTGNRISGYLPGIHLTDEGKAQAIRAAQYLRKKPIAAVYSSPLERAMETAAVIAGKFNLDIHKLDFLKEINFGLLQGLGEELEQQPSWHLFLNTPSKCVFPGGESVIEAQARVVTGLDQLSQTHAPAEEIVCVSHCEAIRLALAHALKKPLDSFMEIAVDTASISSVEWEIDHQLVVSINTNSL
jgi:probable phosphoglycerate mutase